MTGRNRLTKEQRQQLIEWVEAERQTLARKSATIHLAAILAHQALGFAVTRKHIASIVEQFSLGWATLHVRKKPAGSWRCPHCGQLMKKKTCYGCDLSASRRQNNKAAQAHGLAWLTKVLKRGKNDHQRNIDSDQQIL